MSLDKIEKLVSSIAKTVENNEKLATPILAAKLSKYASTHPHDQTIGMMSRIMDDLVDHNTVFIRRSEFKDLYRKLYSHGSKFAELFQEELGEELPQSPVQIAPPHDNSQVSTQYHVGDQILANALNSVFDRGIPPKMYSQPLADVALKSVKNTLDAWSLRPKALTVSAGSDKFLVIQADYDTPKGSTSFYIPVEIQKNKVVEASVFMGNTGPQELNHTNIKEYVTKRSGTKLLIDAQNILDVLTKSSSTQYEISDAELALTRLNAKRQGNSEFAQNQIVGQKMAETSKDVQLPRYEEANIFEEKFNTVEGLAAIQFGSTHINTAKNHILRELASFGHKNPQIVITGHDRRSVFFGVSIDTNKTAFTVPVKIADGKIIKPTILLCNGSIATFDQVGINKLITDNRLDCKVAAAASTLSSCKPSEVIDNLRQALDEGNHTKAEDALNVLANSGDDKAYATAFQIYMNGLSGNKQVKSACQHMVKSAKTTVSEYPICAQTGLPTNKIYQDKDGNCRPLFRRGMSETYEGASFINAKIFG